MKKILIPLILLVCLSLTACSKKVTAESLIDRAVSTTYSGGTLSGRIIFELKLDSDLMIGDGALSTYMKGKVDFKGDRDICYMSSDVLADIMGVTDIRHTEQWSVVKDGLFLSYTRSGEGGDWTYDTRLINTEDTAANSMVNDMMLLDSKSFTDLRLMDKEEGYFVTGATDGEHIDRAMGGVAGLGDELGGLAGPVGVTMQFDKKTLECVALVYDFSTAVADTEGMKTDIFMMGIQIDSHSDEKVQIPEEVKTSAVRKGEEK